MALCTHLGAMLLRHVRMTIEMYLCKKSMTDIIFNISYNCLTIAYSLISSVHAKCNKL